MPRGKEQDIKYRYLGQLHIAIQFVTATVPTLIVLNWVHAYSYQAGYEITYQALLAATFGSFF